MKIYRLIKKLTNTVDRLLSQTSWISEWFWTTSNTSSRLAILLFYNELFPVSAFRWPARATIVLVAMDWISRVLVICLMCQPIQSNWDITLPDGHCGDESALLVFSGAWSMVIDLWVVYLPLPTIWKLKLTPQKKWMLTASFAMGLV